MSVNACVCLSSVRVYGQPNASSLLKYEKKKRKQKVKLFRLRLIVFPQNDESLSLFLCVRSHSQLVRIFGEKSKNSVWFSIDVIGKQINEIIDKFESTMNFSVSLSVHVGKTFPMDLFTFSSFLWFKSRIRD